LQVINRGPAAGLPSTRIAVFKDSGQLASYRVVSPVGAVDASGVYTVAVEGPRTNCDVVDYIIAADQNHQITEQDEWNNYLALSVGDCPDLSEQFARPEDIGRDHLIADPALERAVGFDFVRMVEVLERFDPLNESFRWILDDLVNGPFIPDGPARDNGLRRRVDPNRVAVERRVQMTADGGAYGFSVRRFIAVGSSDPRN
jgi:hypothetical protein